MIDLMLAESFRWSGDCTSAVRKMRAGSHVEEEGSAGSESRCRRVAGLNSYTEKEGP